LPFPSPHFLRDIYNPRELQGINELNCEAEMLCHNCSSINYKIPVPSPVSTNKEKINFTPES